MRRIIADLPEGICTVGVFVNEGFDRIMRTVVTGCLKAVQLHGAEPPELVAALAAEGLLVIKALFVNGQPALDAASRYPAAAFLVECAGGVLPGGNAMSWTWSDARRISSGRPVVLAGGLTPANVQSAIAAANPDAVDVSSGVEESPGRKDIAKVAAFCRAVSTCRNATGRNVFNVTAGRH
jgi:phosphoribosylanthranilate isomerase/indole-3-glycerol phosphate synthase/phosphoribosylanthranilate isomerase